MKVGQYFSPGRMMGVPHIPHTIIEAEISSDAKLLWIGLYIKAQNDNQHTEEDKKIAEENGFQIEDNYKFNLKEMSEYLHVNYTDLSLALMELAQGYLKVRRDRTIQLYSPEDDKTFFDKLPEGYEEQT
jgi:hypothetical protein